MTMKLRHIALSVPDVPAAQKFFEEAFGMTHAGDAQNGVYVTDGTTTSRCSTSTARPRASTPTARSTA